MTGATVKCSISGDLSVIVGTRKGAEKGVYGLKGVIVGAADVNGAVVADCGDETGSMRADFGGTSGGVSDVTLCSLSLFKVRFRNRSVFDGMIRGANCLFGRGFDRNLWLLGELDLLRLS